MFQSIQKNKTLFEILSLIDCKTRKRWKNKKREKIIHSMTYEQYEKMDSKIFESQIGRPLDFDNLHTYTEKMQWAKIYDQDPRKVICADKFAVREYVKEKIGEEYLIPLLGVWDKYSGIDFKKLPNQFVLKTNCGSGELTIVNDKNSMTLSEKIKMRRKIEESLSHDFSTGLCERHYHFIPKKIIAEELIADSNGELNDYKFMCFGGEPKYVWVDIDRHTYHQRNVYDMDWHKLPVSITFPNSDRELEQPPSFNEMKKIATTLCKGFSHVRIDLYNVDGKIYFGEMTFTSNAGFEKCIPEEYDRIIGDFWVLDMNTDKKPFDMVYERNRDDK